MKWKRQKKMQAHDTLQTTSCYIKKWKKPRNLPHRFSVNTCPPRMYSVLLLCTIIILHDYTREYRTIQFVANSFHIIPNVDLSRYAKTTIKTTTKTKTKTTSVDQRHIKRTLLYMVVTPVGPFCPFRSNAAIDVEPKVEGLNDFGPDIALDMTRIQLDMSSGNMPDKEQLLKVASNIETAVDTWENLITRLQVSKDFQTKEYATLTKVHLENSEMSITKVASMMRWQAGCMRSMANNSPPPMPPPDIDLQQLIQQAQNGGATTTSSSPMLSTTAMTAAQQITSTPFTGKESAFDSPTVKDEYEQLCLDHNNMIQFGSKYDDFDPSGKILYLDEIDKIHDRWDIFFTRFQLLNVINKEYIQQCNTFLSSMNMSEDDYRTLLKQCDTSMRIDAEMERTNQFASQ